MKKLDIYLGAEAEKTRITFQLEARKSLDGNILIFDHNEIDVVVMPAKKKVIAYAKGDFSDSVYEVQDRLFTFLKKHGIIGYNSVRGGAVYGSIEGVIEESTDATVNSIDYTLYNIHKFMKKEEPYYDYIEDYEQMLDDYYTSPSDQDSTELGEVPQSSEKGAIKPGYNYEPYWMSYMLEENKMEKKK